MTQAPRFRAWHAFWRMPGSGRFGLTLLIFVGLCSLAVWCMATLYVNPADGQRLRFWEAVYAVFTMLTFETVYPLPRSVATGWVFFVIPLTGLLVLGHGLLRLGRALFDPDAWEAALATTYEHHVIVCGMGKVGFRVTRWLVELGEPVVGIEPNRECRFVPEIRELKVPVLAADARHHDVLEEAGVARASAIVPCADDDLVNLEIALEARRMNPQIKVVLRLFDDRLAENVKHGFDIHTAFSTSALSAPAFAAAATRAPVDYAFSFGGMEGVPRTLLTVCKFTVVPESPLVGYTLSRLEAELNVAVLVHRSGTEIDVHPLPDAVLAPGDGFVVSAELSALAGVAALTPPTQELLRRQRRSSNGGESPPSEAPPKAG